MRWSPPRAESTITGFVLVPGGFQYKTKELFVDGFGKGIVAPLGGGVEPQLKILVCPGKGAKKPPLGKLTVSISVSVALLPQGSFALFVAVMVTGKTPAPVGVPEISPVVVFTVNPPGRPLAS